MFSSQNSQVSNAATYIEDVFSTYLYTGNGTSQTITNNIDLSTKGGLVWLKSRVNAYNHVLTDTARGVNSQLYSNTSDLAGSATDQLTAFNTTGFSVGAGARTNNSGSAIVSWTFRKQPKFFDVVTYTGDGSTSRAISHSLGSVPGCMIIKRTSSDGWNWNVYHRSLNASPETKKLYLEGTDAAYDAYNAWGNTQPTSTSFYVGDNANNANGETYVAYLFAHNAGGFGLTGTDNVISCGGFTCDGSGNATVNLGYEPQWILTKRTSSATDWQMYDTMRGWTSNTEAVGTNQLALRPNLSSAESSGYPYSVNSTGFGLTGVGAGNTFIYIAIRRGPMKVPTDGTTVFSPNVFAAAAGTQINTGFPVDMQFLFPRDGGFSTKAIDRLRGVNSTTGTVSTPWLATANTAAETNGANTLSWNNTGFQMPTDWQYNLMSFNNFRRAPSFFDEVCYTGAGASPVTVNHNLGVVPEFIIVKQRDGAAAWYSTHIGLSNPDQNVVLLNGTNGSINIGSNFYWNRTATTFTDSAALAAAGAKWVSYLFATCAGVSKVGSYTGNGSSQTINCGFAAGARFVLIKRTDSTGDWYVWDTARGIVSGNDPHLSLNTTAAEVTTDDTIDPDSSGFIVNQLAATNVNVNAATYIYLAIA